MELGMAQEHILNICTIVSIAKTNTGLEKEMVDFVRMLVGHFIG